MKRNTVKASLDRLPASPEVLDRLTHLHELLRAKETVRVTDPVEFVLVTPRKRPEWGDPL